MLKTAIGGWSARGSNRRITQTMLVMRLTTLLLTIGFLNVSATGLSQNVSFTGNKVSLESVFLSVKKQTGYLFFYDNTILSLSKPVTISVKDMSVEKFLEEIFRSQPLLKYAIDGKNIIVSRKPSASQQANETSDVTNNTPIDVLGRVVNEKGDPVEGVTVAIKGVSKNTVTGKNGEFSFAAIDQSATLVFTHVSMEPFETNVNGKTNLLIHLKTKVAALDNVVVSVNTGYQTTNRERFIGSTTVIDSALFNRTITTDILSRLEGIAPGVLFIDKSTSRPRIQIRGLSTISQNLVSADALIVVDNFPYYDDLNNINPNDVENITILKDAAAASVWGAKAGNGVIVITTKRGKYNQPFRLSLGSSIRVQEKPDLFYYPQMNSSDFIDVEAFLFDKGFYDANLTNATTWPVISPVVEILARKRAGKLSAAEADAQINSLRNLDVRNDYEKYVFRPAVSWQHYVNFNGGTNLLKYALSLGVDNNQTNIKNNGGYNRYALNSNTSFKPFRALEFTFGLGVTQGETTNEGTSLTYPLSTGGGKSVLYPYAQLADALGNALPITRSYRTAFLDTVGGGKLLDWQYRPLDELHSQPGSSKNLGLRLNLGANVKFTSWLDGSLLWGYTQQTMTSRTYSKPESYLVRDQINRFTQINGSTVIRPIPLGGILGTSNGLTTNNNIRGQLNFNKNWLGKHNVTVMLAGELGENKSSSASNRYYGFDNNVLSYSTSVDYATPFPLFFGGSTARIPNGNSYSEGVVNRTVSSLATLSYSYLDRYRIYGSARKDGANIFGTTTNNKWKPLWSVGAGWDVSKEAFYRIHWMPLLRLRASYGYTGNAGSLSAILTLRDANNGNSPYTQLPMFVINNPPNPDLRWEKIGIINLGIDFSILKDRISGSVEWYQKKTTDALASAPIDYITGLQRVTYNYANLRGRGIDITLNSKNLAGRQFQWNTTLNFSFAKVIITKYYGGYVTTPVSININPREGSLAYAMYSYKWMGLDPATGDPQGLLKGHISKDYQGILIDSFQNQVYHGSSVPLYFGNLLNTFSFKGFSISFNITYRFDYYFRKSAINYTSLYSGWIGHAEYTDRWQKPGDEKWTNVPSMTYPGDGLRDNFYAYSTANVERGDNIRLENIRLGMPAWQNKGRNRFPIQSAQLSFIPASLNIFIWKAGKSGLDPDYSGNAYALPPAKVWAVGLNVNFK